MYPNILQSFIKHLFLIWSASYASFCIINSKEKLTIGKWAAILARSVLLAAVMAILHQVTESKSISMILIVCLVMLMNRVSFTRHMNTAFAVSCISLGITYVVMTTVVLCYGVARKALGKPPESAALDTLLIGVLFFGATVGLFQIKRLRNGLPMLIDSGFSDLGVYICVCVLAVLSINNEQGRTILVIAFILIVFGFALWIWWKRRMVEEYVKRVRRREQKELRETIEAQQKEIDALRKENEVFSAIIHKDNKLLPAMELAVREAAFQMERTSDPEERARHAGRILNELENVSLERSRTVRNYEHEKDPLPLCGIPVLDSLIAYMYCRAKAAGVRFDVRFTGSVSERLPETLEPPDAATLLADLIENAIIASSGQDGVRCVLAEMVFESGAPSLRVSDTAPPIPKEVIRGWGVERVTTHADSGGSGIGMMTTYELCQKYRASFVVNELVPGGEYTKAVCVLFDGAGQFFVGGTADNSLYV